MAGRQYSVLELDGPRLSAVTAFVSKDRIEVKRWLSTVRPPDVAGDDAAAVGDWIGREFKKAGLQKGRAVLAVSRGEIVLKQLSLPAGAEATEADIVGMVRLQMVKQLTMPVEGTSIDYAPTAAGGVSPGGGEERATTVLAGAMPADRVEWCRAVAKHAGLKLHRIGLRCFGAAALLAEISQRRAGPVLGIAIGTGSTEFVIVEDGAMVFARACDVPRPVSAAEIDAFAERLAVEAKRTWMSHRVSKPSPDAELVAVIGEGELAKRVGERCAAALDAPAETIGIPPLVEMPDHMPESDQATAAPLVGLLIERVIKRPTLDFANPRRLPDHAARKRQMVLAAALGLIVVVIGGYIVRDQQLASIRERIAAEQRRSKELATQLNQHLLRHARVSHFDEWSGGGVAWLQHLEHITAKLPERGVVLDSISGGARFSTEFEPKGGEYPAGSWATRQIAEFEIAGTVDGRESATTFREHLLADGLYGVESRGPDTPDRFSLQLITARSAPPDAVERSGESDSGKKEDAKAPAGRKEAGR